MNKTSIIRLIICFALLVQTSHALSNETNISVSPLVTPDDTRIPMSYSVPPPEQYDSNPPQPPDNDELINKGGRTIIYLLIFLIIMRKWRR